MSSRALALNSTMLRLFAGGLLSAALVWALGCGSQVIETGGTASPDAGAGAAAKAELPKALSAEPRLPRRPDGVIELDLAACLEYAFSHNLVMRAERLTDASSQISLRSARAAFLPTITASGEHSDNSSESRSGTLSVSQETPWGTGFSASFTDAWYEGSRTASASASIDQPLFAGFGRAAARNALSKAEVSSCISRADLELEAQNLVYSMTSLYNSAVSQLEVVRVNEQALERSKAYLERTKAFRDVGRKTVLDVSQAEVQLAQRDILLAQARKRLADALDDIKEALDVDPEDVIEVKPAGVELEEVDTEEIGQIIEIEYPDPAASKNGAVRMKRTEKKAEGGPREDVRTIFEPQKLDYEGALSEALRNRLEIANARWRLVQARMDLDYQRNQARPDLDLSLTYNLSKTAANFADASSFSTDDDAWTVGLTYTYPWGKVSDKVALEQAKLTVGQREISLRQTEQQVKMQVREQLRLLDNTRQNILALALQTKGASRALEAAKVLVEHEKADSFQIIEAEANLLSAQSGFIQNLLDYKTQLTRLDQLLGRTTGRVDCRLLKGSVRVEPPRGPAPGPLPGTEGPKAVSEQ